MEIRDLQFFLSVAENSSFTIAAEKENISQSAISKAIIRLEKELGVKLFTRMHHSIALTETGQYLYDNLSMLLPDLLDVLVRAASSAEKKSIRYATSIPYGCLHQPEILSIFMRNNPDIILTANYELTSEEIIKQMREGAIDIALIHLLFPDSNAFDSRILFHDSLYVILPRDHSLANKPSISIEDLSKENILLNSRHIEEILNYISKKYSRRLKSNVIDDTTHGGRSRITSMVSFNFGIGVFYKSDLEDLSLSGLIPVPIEGIPDIPIILAVSRYIDVKDYHTTFINYLCEQINAILPPG